MPLPILKVTNEPSRDDLLRYFHRTQLHWTRHVADETQFDFGAAFLNPELPDIYDANQILDAFVPDGFTPDTIYAQVTEHFAAKNLKCRKWVLSPSASKSQTEPLMRLLVSQNHQFHAADVLYLNRSPSNKIAEVSGLTIIPGRAAYRHARILAEEWAAEFKAPNFAAAIMLHLDGDHTDTLVALKDGKPAAIVFVLAVGEIGTIEELFVSAEFRNQGIGRTMLSRAMEICARALFKHVFVATNADNAAAQSLYKQFGFIKIGQIAFYYDAPGD